MKKLIGLLLACFSINNACAAVYHGIFTGTVANIWYPEGAPFSDGAPFTVRFEVDTTSHDVFATLKIADVNGTFGNVFVSIFDNEYGQDRFEMVSNLDSPDGIFDGLPNSNLGLDFIGGTGLFTGTGLDQPFSTAQLTSFTGSFDVGAAQYGGDLLISSGAYLPGPLPQLPLPAAGWLFGSGLIGMLGFARRKIQRST